MNTETAAVTNPLTESFYDRAPQARRWPTPLVGGGAVVLVFCAAAAFVWPHAMARSYLFAYLFWLNVSAGAFGWLMLGHVTGGEWGRTTRRICEAASLLIPLLGVLGIPLLFGAHWLYGWADASVWQNDVILEHRRPWISLPWVAGRAAVIFGVWSLLAFWLRGLSLRQSRATDGPTILALGKRMRTISQGGLAFLFASVFVLSVDWVMALEPHWVSTIFGLLILMGQACGSIAMVILVLALVERLSGRPIVTKDQTHDLGKILLTALILWAYMSFFQYLVQWMGQTQEDIRWYVRRLGGGWSWVAMALCIFHLGVPLLLLLSKPLKRNLDTLWPVAAWIFFMRIVDVLWTIAPAGPGEKVGGIYPGDPLLWLGLGGVWAGAMVVVLARAPLRPTAYLTSGADVTGVVVAEGAVRAG